MTNEQAWKIGVLGGQLADFHTDFSLPPGYVSGWAKGVFYGIDAEGQASS